jgi:SIR2-like domain
VPGRTYHPVTKAGELTTAFAPRIVKLHGSFPTQTPFIITEDDFRTYPRKFVPFVNTVQQSLLENSFVLIGFSGDDPNFLEWTGWIRDEFGGNHADWRILHPACGEVPPALVGSGPLLARHQ